MKNEKDISNPVLIKVWIEQQPLSIHSPSICFSSGGEAFQPINESKDHEIKLKKAKHDTQRTD